MVTGTITGWDIGGAHLKMAVVDMTGKVIAVDQYPTPLWQGLEALHDSLSLAQSVYRQTATRHAVTVTGELADIFPDRRHGIQALSDCLLRAIRNRSIRFYGGNAEWILPQFAVREYQRIASANWHATASYAATVLENGILLDIGTTTTDIIAFSNGRVQNSGYSDYTRLACGELVYTGIVRTPVMAVTDTVDIEGRAHPLVAEVFATMADVYRVLGQLDAADDMLPTADGAGKQFIDSIRRIARMTGRDLDSDSDISFWQDVASDIARRQKARISRGLETVLSGMDSRERATIVGAGAGRFLAKTISSDYGLSYVDFADLLDTSSALRSPAARSAPAVAVALLAMQA